MAKLNAYNYSLFLLQRKDYSVGMLCKKLVSKEYSDEDIIDAVNLLKERNYLNDERLVERTTENLSTRGKSPMYIRQKLRQMSLKFDDGHFKNLVANNHDATLDAVKKMLEKKFQQIKRREDDSRKQLHKLFQFLQSKGLMSREYREYATTLTRAKYSGEFESDLC